MTVEFPAPVLPRDFQPPAKRRRSFRVKPRSQFPRISPQPPAPRFDQPVQNRDPVRPCSAMFDDKFLKQKQIMILAQLFAQKFQVIGQLPR